MPRTIGSAALVYTEYRTGSVCLLSFSRNINHFNLIVFPGMFSCHFSVFTCLCSSFLAPMLSLQYDRVTTTFVCFLQDEKAMGNVLVDSTITHTPTHEVRDVETLCRCVA
jgi:hypothetical protein